MITRFDKLPPGTPLYSLSGICKDFQVDEVIVPALAGVSICLQPGRMVVLQGASGSGKSTLLNVLGLIERPTAGTVTFAGMDVTNTEDDALTLLRRDHIGFIFQNFNLLSVLTAVENVEYPLYLEPGFNREEVRQRAMASLAEVGLSDVARHRPSQLSGGQRQRVAIARALVKHPRVVLADEPTANLDSRTASQIMDLLGKLQDESAGTIIVASHDPDVAALAHQRIHIRDGRVERID